MNTVIKRKLDSGGEAEDTPHCHDQGQFILVRRGILHGYAGRNSWVLLAGMVAWIPAGVEHWGRASKSVELAVLYLEAEQCRKFPQTARHLPGTPLMAALCDRLIDGQNSNLPLERAERMTKMLVEEIADAPSVGLVLPLPSDPRLKRLINALMAEPFRRLTLAEWGQHVGASERTLIRLFRRETGLRFSEWHDRFLLAEAVRGLADGLSNERLADNLGFASGDSFGHWFRRVTGGSPSNFVDRLNANNERLQLSVSFDNLSGGIIRSAHKKA